MEYYAGLDVSLRSVAICVLDGEGKIVFERSVACEVDVIASSLAKASFPITRIGFEAGTMSQPLFYGLKEQHGFEVVCMEARQVHAALSAMRNKTDKNDARGIAQVLRSGWYSPVHMKSRRSHAMRTLMSSRKACLSKCIDLANEVRGLLKVYGIRLPERVKHTRFDAIVRPLIEVHPDLSLALVPLLDARLALLRTYQELDKRVKHAASTNAVCLRLMEIPGVGPMTALAFVAAVDDPARFKSSRTVAAHFGLTPRRFQSGETDNPGRISKAGDMEVRCALYTAANAMLMRSIAGSSIKSWGMHLMRTKGRRRAVVAVARKLAVVMHRMWVNDTSFCRDGLEAAA